MEQSWDGRSDMLILRLNSPNRMVTKGYRKGVYEWVWRIGEWRTCAIGTHARATAVKTNTRRTSSRGFGSLRKTCHATKLIGDSSARGRPANESVGPAQKTGHRKLA